VTEIIIEKLASLEADYNIKILLAIESGSRAWGFPSPDSDYDVRFIYVHPADHYLSIDDQRDVIEVPINDLLDINGWELRKALRLFRKSNGPLYEWLQSPSVYRQHPEFVQDMMKLMPEYFSPRAAMHHYLSMTKGVFENELAGDFVRLKKYFYALRPILACRWIADKRAAPPMEFGSLRVSLGAELQATVDELLKQKAVVDEKYMIKPIKALHDFIQGEIDYCEKSVPVLADSASNVTKLNNLFRAYLK